MIHFFPEIPRKVHAFFGNDPHGRIEFCINKLKEKNPIFSAESCAFNRNNHRHWNPGNKHVVVKQNFQRRFSVKWCDIFGDRLVGPFYYWCEQNCVASGLLTSAITNAGCHLKKNEFLTFLV
jgi:hypothetical protein